MTNRQFTADENFIIKSALKGLDSIKKGHLALVWVHRRGKYLAQWFVRGKLVKAAVLTAEAFLACFRGAIHWIIRDWGAGT